MKKRRDKNHKEIVNQLKKIGCSVIDTSQIGKGFFDIIVGYRKKTYLIEIKSDTAYGRKGLSESQRIFAEEWKGGEILCINSIEDFIKLI